jgi:hypothetical protein
MLIHLLRRRAVAAMLALSGMACAASPAAASYLFWTPPDFSGAPVRGDEPGLGLAMPGATPKELGAHLLWNLRAGLNVAALQCQFAPTLATVKNYNTLLKQHDAELDGAYDTLNAYFKRQSAKGWQTAFDQYTTKTYNGFSTLHAQLGFCETAAAIGRDAIGRTRGTLHETAETRMREFRNSLVPAGDSLFAMRRVTFASLPTPPLDSKCWNKRDEMVKKCVQTWNMTQAAAPPTAQVSVSGATPVG